MMNIICLMFQDRVPWKARVINREGFQFGGRVCLWDHIKIQMLVFYSKKYALNLFPN